MIRSISFIIINVLLLLTLSSCKNDLARVDISDIDLELKVHRFDQELFVMDFDTVNQAISSFYEKYGDFFDIFNVHVVNLGPASQRHYASYLSMFVNDPQNREVYEFTQERITAMAEIEHELTDAFRRYLYHFPDSLVPEVVAYVSRFNHKIFTVGNYIGIGLDQYLGRDCEYYDMLRTPVYLQYNMHQGKIVSDVANVWASAQFPYNDSVDNVLNQMIYQGLLLYFEDALLPGMADSLKIGFSPDQMKFVKNNEKQMWSYLIEHKLLFSTDPLVIKKLVEDAPNTSYFPSESPGRSAVWLGWQIVRAYAKRFPELTVADIVSERDYQKILNLSRYNP